MKSVRISDKRAAYTPAQKAKLCGPGTLSDCELLALFLGRTPEQARDLIIEHGSLRSVLDLPTLPGITAARKLQLSCALELSLRFTESSLVRGAALTEPQVAGKYLKQKLQGRSNEVFMALYLDTRHRLIATEELFHGTVDGSKVHPRVVVTRALAHNAVAMIIGHNHPSGDAEPSAADRAVTARLKQALALVEVRLLDHFVVGDGVPVSLAARGWV